MMKRQDKGLSMIEVLLVVAILAILILMATWTYQRQVFKGRDARRKGDLNKLQKVLEDYMNDKSCYPNPDQILTDVPNASPLQAICKKTFLPYLVQLPCDPKNNLNYNYFYSYDGSQGCKKWYKIYTKLEDTKDPTISKVGCPNGCGPGQNYNYWVSSPNMAEVAQLPGEVWPTVDFGAPTSPPAGTPTPLSTPMPTSTVSPTPAPTSSPAPTTSPVPTTTVAPTPTPTSSLSTLYGCFNGQCWPLAEDCDPHFSSPNCASSCHIPANNLPEQCVVP